MTFTATTTPSYVLAPPVSAILTGLIEPNAPSRSLWCESCKAITEQVFSRTRDGLKRYSCRCGSFVFYMVTRPKKQ